MLPPGSASEMVPPFLSPVTHSLGRFISIPSFAPSGLKIGLSYKKIAIRSVPGHEVPEISSPTLVPPSCAYLDPL